MPHMSNINWLNSLFPLFVFFFLFFSMNSRYTLMNF